SRLFEREWDRFLATELGPEARRAGVWRRALAVPGGLDAVHDLALALSSFAFPDEAGPHPSPVDLLRDAAGAPLSGGRAIRERAPGLLQTLESFLLSAADYLAGFLAGGPRGMAEARTAMALREFIDRQVPGSGRKLAGATPEEVTTAARRAQAFVKAAHAI